MWKIKPETKIVIQMREKCRRKYVLNYFLGGEKSWFLAFEYCILENLTAFTNSVLNFIPVC